MESLEEETSDFISKFSDVLNAGALECAEEFSEINLCSDLYLALTVLEKLEYVYSNSWIASREYEKALELALRQCNKCHELVKAKFPRIECFVEAFRDSHCSFQRALVQLRETQNQPSPSISRPESVTIKELLFASQEGSQFKVTIETWEYDYRVQVGRLKDGSLKFSMTLSPLNPIASQLDRFHDMQDWIGMITELDSLESIDSGKLKADLTTLLGSIQVALLQKC